MQPSLCMQAAALPAQSYPVLGSSPQHELTKHARVCHGTGGLPACRGGRTLSRGRVSARLTLLHWGPCARPRSLGPGIYNHTCPPDELGGTGQLWLTALDGGSALVEASVRGDSQVGRLAYREAGFAGGSELPLAV